MSAMTKFILFVSVNGSAWVADRTFSDYGTAQRYASQMETRFVRTCVRKAVRA